METDKNKINLESWDKVAELYEQIFMDVDLYNDTYDTFCNLLPQSGCAIFEIGCGPGNITRYLLAKRPDLKITAIDSSPSMIELAEKNNPAVAFRIMDCRDIDTLNEKFDGIMCGFCVPYLSKEDLEKLIDNSSQLLHRGGIIYISAIEGNYDDSGFEKSSSGETTMYVHYYSEKELTAVLNKYDFHVSEVIRKKYFRNDGTESTHLIIISKRIDGGSAEK